MKTFKEQLAADRASFFNLNEFAEEHVINGTTVKVVLGDNTSTKQKTTTTDADFEDISSKIIKFSCLTADLPCRFVKGNNIEFDDDMYLVEEVANDLGITDIILRAEYA